MQVNFTKKEHTKSCSNEQCILQQANIAKYLEMNLDIKLICKEEIST